MTQHDEARIAYARELSKLYLPNEKIQAIVVSGSTARQFSDEYSDLELAIFWKEAPLEEERNSPLKKLGAQVSRQITPDNDFFYGVDNFLVGDFAVDVVHNLCPRFQQLVESIVSAQSADTKRENLVAMCQSFFPVFGGNFVRELQSICLYTTEFANKLLGVLEPANIGVMTMHAQRGDVLSFQRFLCKGVEDLLRLCCILNYRFFPQPKRLKPLLSNLKTCPENFEKRILEIFRLTPTKAIEEYSSLLTETLHLLSEDFDLPDHMTRLLHRKSRRAILQPDQINFPDLD